MRTRLVTLLLLAVVMALGQLPSSPQVPGDRHQEDPKLPDGRSQKEAILKADHEQSLKDAALLMKLSEELKIDLEKNDRHVLSVATLKKLDDIEKVARRIRGRMKKY